MSADSESRARNAAQMAAETDPVQREAYALAARAGFDWYNTESQARRAFEHAAEEILRLRHQILALNKEIDGLRAAAEYVNRGS